MNAPAVPAPSRTFGGIRFKPANIALLFFSGNKPII
jgi:hypothetical protein